MAVPGGKPRRAPWPPAHHGHQDVLYNGGADTHTEHIFAGVERARQDGLECTEF